AVGGCAVQVDPPGAQLGRDVAHPVDIPPLDIACEAIGRVVGDRESCGAPDAAAYERRALLDSAFDEGPHLIELRLAHRPWRSPGRADRRADLFRRLLRWDRWTSVRVGAWQDWLVLVKQHSNAGRNGLGEIGIVQNDVRRLAAELLGHAFDGSSGGF